MPKSEEENSGIEHYMRRHDQAQMTKPARSAKGERAKKQLISAAATLMKEKDTIDVTLLEVAEHSGLNGGLVKYHFGNKEGLQIAVLEEEISLGRDLLKRLVARDHMPPERKLRLHLEGLVATYHNAPYINRLTQSLTRNASGDRLNDLGEHIIRPIVHAQAQILKEGYEAGVFRKVDPMSFYFASISATEGLYSQRFVLNEGFGVDEIDEAVHEGYQTEVVTLLLNGVLR